ncbi:SpoIIE family protein phosphatase [Nonomuraea jiangxiensis]|uniref:Serine phosphatase RsbU, regulator of sigma subunit n=1 Tax=Nonomuraea jiangxiensis TaxID=633440 RepID=A0A1G9G3Y9_9ACTN|nr:SpoIIE family protein phosphatase [Nonomuraea jiangxiensis]SDK95359.1 Serine phosphatase RsbU, regulator of sigma subunit [Nonomuraea jiangxiensis]
MTGSPGLIHALAAPDRLKALERVTTIEALARETLDRSARLAARLLDVPVVLVTFVETDRQRVVQHVGSRHPRTAERIMPLSWGFSPIVVIREQPLVIGDVRSHAAYASNPAVGPTRMRAFAGVPLVLDGQAVGTMCAVHTRPHRWTTDQLRTLGELATAAMSEIRLQLEFSATSRLSAQAEATRRRSQQLQGLAQASIEINSASSLAEALNTVTEKARKLIGAHQSTSSLTRSRSWAQTVTATSLSDKYAAWRGFDAAPTGEGIYAQVCSGNQTMRLSQEELEAQPGWRGFGEYADRHPPMRGWLAVPLIASDGGNLGLIQVSDKMDGGDFTIDDEAILTQLAELAASCIEKTAALDKQREIARTLQQSLLPPHLPDIPGVELAARYHSADDESQVGGDFYDVFQSRDGRWGIILGDVCGKDTEAASLTALVRHTARAALMIDPDPAHVARVLNDAVRTHATERFCTLIYLTLCAEGDGLHVDMAVCGHPLPLRVDRRGAVREVGEPGPLIGVLSRLSVRTTRFAMSPGDTLMLFTDGITEARRHGPMFGETMLPALLKGSATMPLPELADTVSQAALDYQGGRLNDDIATLFVRAAPGGGVRAAPGGA